MRLRQSQLHIEKRRNYNRNAEFLPIHTEFQGFLWQISYSIFHLVRHKVSLNIRSLTLHRQHRLREFFVQIRQIDSDEIRFHGNYQASGLKGRNVPYHLYFPLSKVSVKIFSLVVEAISAKKIG